MTTHVSGTTPLKGEALLAELEALLPRLRRFALILTGEETLARTILKELCTRVLAVEDPLPGGEAFAQLVFSELYVIWHDDVGSGRVIPPKAETSAALFAELCRPQGEAGRILGAFLAGLPPKQRMLLLLVHGEGLSYAEAAEVLALPHDAALSLAAEASQALTERIGLGEEAAA